MTAAVVNTTVRTNTSPKIRNILSGIAGSIIIVVGVLVGGHYLDHVPETPPTITTSSAPVISVTPTTSSIDIQLTADGKLAVGISSGAR